MQSKQNHSDSVTNGELKQVKVDNWGTFFLQRLLQLYCKEELLDLSLRFPTSNNMLKVHKLVVTTCTDYFHQLYQEQNGDAASPSDVIEMPSDMPFECVKSIIRFMYTGQLDFWTAELNSLYATALKLKMSVLTKLLDAQMDSSNPSPPKRCVYTPASALKQTTIKTEPSGNVSDRKVLAPKKKTESHSATIIMEHVMDSPVHYPRQRTTMDVTEGPSRFDLPEVEELTLGVFSSFDDITYNTQPIVQAFEKNTTLSADNTLDDTTFKSEDLPPVVKEQKASSSDDDWEDPDTDFLGSKNGSDSRRNFGGSNQQFSPNTASGESGDNHEKIIREVLKKYPHLVEQKKNIRLKIMQKDAKSECAAPGKTKVSYVVMKPDSLLPNNTDKSGSRSTKDGQVDNSETGPWKCYKCDLEEHYTSYQMYRRHMQDVHDEKFDPRVCEHCGFKASKRNILMYHLYTKHNVPPPKNMSFPKCKLCPYVALSESLMVRHQLNHKHKSSNQDSQRSTSDSAQNRQCVKNQSDSTGKIKQVIKSEPQSLDYTNTSRKFFTRSEKSVQPSSVSKSQSTKLSYDARKFIPYGKDGTKRTFVKQEKVPANSVDGRGRNQQMVAVNDEDYQFQNIQDYPVTISGDDEIMVQNSDRGMVVYVQDSNYDASDGSNVIYETRQYTQMEDGTVEEVVEELEAIEEDGESGNVQTEEVQRMDTDEQGNHNTDQTTANESTEIEEVIEYLEEETEILEYETHPEN
ncbi:hypothetical protein QAD02_015393 [Eretmocerus hayati]|uniref:Uncharacterized protein n=1 Tax=Eretmocerus hayati TaxID=131215 RepID=A0ACC2P9D7_9HYME|nr:hypothetical protein QAD02_015393 [Eretmocerus hayati]